MSEENTDDYGYFDMNKCEDGVDPRAFEKNLIKPYLLY